MNVYFKFSKFQDKAQRKVALKPEFVELVIFAIDNGLTLMDGGPYEINYPQELVVESREIRLTDTRMEQVVSDPLADSVIAKMRSKVKSIDRREFEERTMFRSNKMGVYFYEPWEMMPEC